MRLEQQTPTYLQNAHIVRTCNDSEAACAAQGASRSIQVYEVEDIRRFTPKLELRTIVDREVTEDRRIDILITWTVKRVRTHQTIQS